MMEVDDYDSEEEDDDFNPDEVSADSYSEEGEVEMSEELSDGQA